MVVVRPWLCMLALAVLVLGGGGLWAYTHPIVLTSSAAALPIDAPAVPPAGTLVLGTATLRTKENVHVAVVLYARFPDAANLTRRIFDQLPCVAANETGVAQAQGAVPCPDVAPDPVPPGTERMLALLDEPVRLLSDAGGLAGSTFSDAELDLGGSFLLVKLASASVQTEAQVDEREVGRALEGAQAQLRAACARLPRDLSPRLDCALAIGNFSLVAEWDPSLAFHASLERPERTNVLGPLAWSAVSNLTLVLPDGTTQAAPKGVLRVADIDGVFMPTSALAWGVGAFLLSFAVDPIARAVDRIFPRFRLEPFLPVPMIGALATGVLLYATSQGWLGGLHAFFSIFLPVVAVYLLVILVYRISDLPGSFDFVTTAWALASILLPVGYLAYKLLHLEGIDPIAGLGLFYAPDLRLQLRVHFLQAFLLFVALLVTGALLLVAYELLARQNARAFVRARLGVDLTDPAHPREVLLAESLFERHPKGLRQKGLARGGRLYLLRRHVLREREAAKKPTPPPAGGILKVNLPPPPGPPATPPRDTVRRRRRATFRDLASRL